MSPVSSFGSVGFVLVCLYLLPVTSHFMTPSTTHIGFTGSSPVQEIQGNPAQRVRLIRRSDKVPHWEYAVSSGPFFGNPAYYRTRYSRPPAPRLCPLICEDVPKTSAYQVSTSCQQISLRLPNQTCITSAERVKDIPAKSSIAVHHVHPPLPRE